MDLEGDGRCAANQRYSMCRQSAEARKEFPEAKILIDG